MRPRVFLALMAFLLAASAAWLLVLYPSRAHGEGVSKGRVYFLLPITDGIPRIPDCNEGEIMLERGGHTLWLCDGRHHWWSLVSG